MQVSYAVAACRFILPGAMKTHMVFDGTTFHQYSDMMRWMHGTCGARNWRADNECCASCHAHHTGPLAIGFTP